MQDAGRYWKSSASAPGKTPNCPGRPGDLAALARLLPNGQLRQMRLIIPPQTLLRWHAVLVRRRWVYPCRTPRGPQAIAVWWRWPRDNPAGVSRASTASLLAERELACPKRRGGCRTQPRGRRPGQRSRAGRAATDQVGEQRSVTTA